MRKLILIIAFILICFSNICEAAQTIGQFNPVTKWTVTKTDNGYEYLDYQFTEIDTTHTKVSMSIITDTGLSKQEVITEIKKVESDAKQIPLSKVSGAGVFIDKANFDLESLGVKEFIITHPAAFVDGWEIKIGTASATVGTTTDANAIHCGSKKHVGSFGTTDFVFFHDGSNAMYSYSVSGGSWQTPAAIFSGETPPATGYTVRISGSRVDVACDGSTVLLDPVYRQGTLSSSGISWGNSDVAVTEPNRRTFTGSSVLSDSSDFAVLTAQDLRSGGTNAIDATQTDGQAWGTSVLLGGTDNNLRRMLVFDVSALEASRDLVFVLQVGATEDLGFKFYDQSTTTWDAAWTQIESDANLSGTWTEIFDGTQDSSGNIYVISKDASAGELHIWRITDPSAGTFDERSTDITGESSTTKACIGADGDDLYCFYNKGVHGIYYKVSTNGGTTWGSENELKATGGLNILGGIACSEQSANSKIGVTWAEDDTTDIVVFDEVSVSAVAATFIPKIQWFN